MLRFVKASALIAVVAAIEDSEWEQFKTQYQNITLMLRFVKASALIAVVAAIEDSEWEQFKTQYQKHYANDAEEMERYGLYKKSKSRVEKLNALNPEPVFGITSMSDRHPEEQFKKGLRMPVDFVPTAPVKQYVPRNSGGVNWGVTEVVSAVKNQGQCGSCWAFSATQAVESQLVLTSGGNALNPEPVFGITSMSDRHPEEQFKKGLRMPVDFVPTAPVKQYVPRNSGGVNWGVTEVVSAVKNQGQCGSCWAFSATQAVESQLVLTSGGYRVDLSPQQITSCTPSTGTYGCYGCDGGWTEGAYDYLSTVAGLANSFYIPYEQSLTEETATMACPTEKVANITGEYQRLQGAYAKVTGYHYATTPCTSGACGKQDLQALAAALEAT
eukprot:CAMPEP_0194549774 /NCGR_PEP_ID=MMETSP0253-20130528/95374_1 /TAXON_ID=2966 /ORGANISM="Noctiluca scintillans" /LENGTH=384 /DNA_ID=CAMNT_0039397207 /DNA_START=238 /DNA_END=1391 /DNA_ORIENTATION=-